ncbi:MAG TPA: glycosyltransferase [Anaerolineales bacterium]|nr:glycosyltransferase [Anaerolineales bacterium]
MRITILTAGSRGDVQPYVALGIGLQRLGFKVRIATHKIFASLIREYDLDFAPLEGDPRAVVQAAEGRDWVASGRNPFGFLAGFQRLMGPVMQQAFQDAWVACQDSQAVLVSSLGFYPGHSIAHKLGVPLLQAYLQPIHPTSAFPSPIFPTPLKGHILYNYLTHVLGGQLFWQVMRPGLNLARHELLDLPPLPGMGALVFWDLARRSLPVVYGYSPSVLPRPHSWGEWINVVGYWFMPESDWTPPNDLADFIAAGKPPVYVGFGSMADRDPERLTGIVLEALARSGQRAVVLSGWGGLQPGDLPDSVFPVNSVPHAWLFLRVAAIVHHGGAGTTASALRAGVPSIVVPFFGDQFFWGQTITRLGVSPGVLERRELNGERLASFIHAAVQDQGVRSRAEALGARIRAESGVEKAAALFKSYLRA